MRSEVIVVDQILEKLVGEVLKIVEGCALDHIIVQRSPEALDLAVGLRPIGPGVAMLDAELEQHGLEGVLFGFVAGGELGAVVGQDLGELDAIGDVEGVDHLQGLEHDRQGLFRGQHLGPGQARATIDQADDKGRGLRRHQEHVAGQLVQVDMTQFADLVLDNATFLLAHGRSAASADGV
jgi:hypothetical protein